MYLVRTPGLIKPFFKDLLWNVPDADDSVYLTFDDGPIPEVTPWVLDLLAEHEAKATFFCIGRNVERHPTIFERIKAEGHSIGNHTYEHVNGWNTSLFGYLRSVLRCHALTGSNLFRPPYGRITMEQANVLARKFQIVMWDVLSADFDQRTTGKECSDNVIDNFRPGSIIVFHDSLKAWDRLQVALPRVLKELRSKGIAMKPLIARNDDRQKSMDR